MPFFDGPNRRIILNDPVGGVLNVNVQDDLYEKGKEWVRGILPFNTETDVGATQIDLLDYSLHTGQRVLYTKEGGTEAIGLTDSTYYFVRYLDRTSFELYDTKANAEAGPATTGRIALTASGVGNGENHQFYSDNAKFFVPWRTSGGDPLTPGVEAGAYFFIQNQLGSDWRIISSDEDQTINYAGNLVAEDSLLSLIVPTPGRTVLHLGLQPVTQRVDELLTQSQLAIYQGRISIDTIDGVDGTEFPAGTRSAPVKTLTAALALAMTFNFLELELRGSLVLDQPLAGYFVRGYGVESMVDFGGQNISGTHFDSVSVEGVVGTITVPPLLSYCSTTGLIDGWRGKIVSTAFAAGLRMVSGLTEIFNSWSAVAGGASPEFDANGQTGIDFVLRNWNGGAGFNNFTQPDTIMTTAFGTGACNIRATCTAVSMWQLRGLGEVNNDSALVIGKDGQGDIDGSGFFYARDLAVVKAATAGRATFTDIGGGQVRIDLYDDDQTTVIHQMVLNADETERTVL